MIAPLPRVPPARAVIGAVGEARFVNLLRLARETVARLPWEARLQELELDLDRLARAVGAGASATAETWPALFDAFVGHWVGGDLHDADRAYRHIWFPASLEGELLAQPVMMLGDESERPILAYNVARRTRVGVEIRGVVGPHAHVGFRLEAAALLWVGEQPEGWTSIHAERVRARGQLYDIRGLVFRRAPDGQLETAPSDWRYHRVAPGAIRLPAAG